MLPKDYVKWYAQSLLGIGSAGEYLDACKQQGRMDPFADAEARFAAALREKAALLRERRVQIDGGLSAQGSMSVMEEIE